MPVLLYDRHFFFLFIITVVLGFKGKDTRTLYFSLLLMRDTRTKYSGYTPTTPMTPGLHNVQNPTKDWQQSPVHCEVESKLFFEDYFCLYNE